MLPGLTLPVSLAGLLGALRPCFTAPSFVTFCGLAAGLAGQVRRRTVCGMLLGAGLAQDWPHDRAHYFFARARWQADELGLAVARLVVALLVPEGAAITVAVDDSLFRRCGRKVHGAAWQHDGSAPARGRVSFGNCFVAVAIVVTLPFCTRPVALPVLARLHLPGKGTRAARVARRQGRAPGSKVSHAAALVTLLAGEFPGRAVHVVADAAYHGPALKTLPAGVTWTCRLPKNAVLYALAPPRAPGTIGRPRRKGARLGTWADLATAAAWTPATAWAYGRNRSIRLADITCLWYGCLDTATVRVVVAPRPGRRPGPGHHRSGRPRHRPDHPVRLPVVHRAGPRRRPHPRRRRSPQPHPPRRRAHHPVRPAHLHHDHHLVRPARSRPSRPRRPPRRPALVRHQDRARLRGHAHPAPPRPHHRPHFRRFPNTASTRTNPGRPGRMARSRRITAKHQSRPNRTKHTPKREQAMRSQHDHGSTGGGATVGP